MSFSCCPGYHIQVQSVEVNKLKSSHFGHSGQAWWEPWSGPRQGKDLSRYQLSIASTCNASCHSMHPMKTSQKHVMTNWNLVEDSSEAIQENITCETCETFEQFKTRVLRTIENVDPTIIDKAIESMPQRIRLIIKGKGYRTKYWFADNTVKLIYASSFISILTVP